MKKKILIKSPLDRDELIKCFPACQVLRENFPEAEINVIADRGNDKLFQFLKKLQMRVFPLSQENRSVPGLHKYAANLNDVFNIDIFFDFEGSIKSSLLGLFFRASEKVGSPTGVNQFFYDKKLTSKAPLKMIETYLNKDYSLRAFSGGNRFLSPQDFKFPHYYLVFLDEILLDQRAFWSTFFTSIKKEQILFWTAERKSELYTFVESLQAINPQGHYKILFDEYYDKLESYSLYSKAVISSSKWPCYLASYLVVDSIYVTFDQEQLAPLSNFRMNSRTLFANDHYRLDDQYFPNMEEVIEAFHLS